MVSHLLDPKEKGWTCKTLLRVNGRHSSHPPKPRAIGSLRCLLPPGDLTAGGWVQSLKKWLKKPQTLSFLSASTPTKTRTWPGTGMSRAFPAWCGLKTAKRWLVSLVTGRKATSGASPSVPTKKC